MGPLSLLRQPARALGRRGDLLGKLFVAALIPIVVYSLSVVAEISIRTYHLKQEAALVREEVEAEKRENIRLQQELAFARSDQGIEDSARRHLNLVMPGDHAVVLSGLPTPGPVSLAPPTRQPAPTGPTDGFVEWARWLLARLGR
jgi:cell division protein FtsB